MKLIKFVYLVAIVLIITGCPYNVKERYSIELNDSIKQVISTYVEENNIDVKSKIITTEWIVNDYRTNVYISNLYSKLYEKEGHTPTYYAIIDNKIIVLIYAGIEKAIFKKTDEILGEIDYLVQKNQIKLSLDTGYFYYAPTWLYSVCGEESKLVKKFPPFEYNFIPCGYTLLQDTVRKDSLFVIRSGRRVSR
jgi:hypothetical protein